MSIKRTSHARYEIWYHIAWCTKYRKKVFIKENTKESVKKLLRKIAEAYDMEISNIEILSDHVHLLLSTPPRIAPSRAVQILKSISTKALFEHYPWLKQIYWGSEVWVGGYFVRTVGPGLTKEDITQYIKEQSEEI
ncbi:MAG: IS200/IS605 family transposase [Candidatus Komeilibacteria bacterium CG11_big_fil_rev_8_21_14_0_20_36_20]|uniref:IS200/IS605 family transposase n=1 Tax=Candidatus Komeilibacteria bacterium CG11_big_fil_rev_8_21_14_0_20_36_20 TaxID=1974477 RepID=A0A2H0NEE9_9BACT|nr:MAG: IS200/IS605 family transposase [Candidatus Komeilibacteria bacterium CG11_big_fil_rev_8_21_14_0_20_36_20]PIR82112.1 MAG: IS200/IS605 family transposase [Candidatus Komeilibacteria bacterium CG10_big_fil_rev_8_21_14_0_10_36_65]PJC55784.1 MAG: IS200/IS605 family transposase [Candidatus Komeilibacteria bacterium CG_4_9_14_0_2_um_filter_36_13]